MNTQILWPQSSYQNCYQDLSSTPRQAWHPRNPRYRHRFTTKALRFPPKKRVTSNPAQSTGVLVDSGEGDSESDASDHPASDDPD